MILHVVWWFWLHMLWTVAWPLDWVLYHYHHNRLMRGVVRRWLVRRYGIMGYHLIGLGLSTGVLVAFVSFLVMNRWTAGSIAIAVYWTVVTAVNVIDYITGGDDPPRRLRKRTAELVRKLRIAPPPRPVIQI